MRTTANLRSLLEKYAHDVEIVVRRHVDDEMDRDDLRQEIAIAVWQAMPRFLGRSSERTYIMRIAQNRAVTYRLRMARNRALFEPLEAEPAPHERHSGEHDLERLHNKLADALGRLPDRQREVLELSVAGHSPRQIAVRTGNTAGAVRVALHRARQTLRRWLGAGESGGAG